MNQAAARILDARRFSLQLVRYPDPEGPGRYQYVVIRRDRCAEFARRITAGDNALEDIGHIVAEGTGTPPESMTQEVMRKIRRPGESSSAG